MKAMSFFLFRLFEVHLRSFSPFKNISIIVIGHYSENFNIFFLFFFLFQIFLNLPLVRALRIYSIAAAVYFEILNKIHRTFYNVICLNQATQLQSHFDHRLLYKYFHRNCSYELSSLLPKLNKFNHTKRWSRCNRKLYPNSLFFMRYLPVELFRFLFVYLPPK